MIKREDQYVKIYGVVMDGADEYRPYVGYAVTFAEAVAMAKGLVAEGHYYKVCLKDSKDKCVYIEGENNDQ